MDSGEPSFGENRGAVGAERVRKNVLVSGGPEEGPGRASEREAGGERELDARAA
jgi:hypothetical protein